MDAYKRWVRRNRDYVHSLESLANVKRFSESEIGPEAVTTFLGIITAIYEHIIEMIPSQKGSVSPEPHSFPYSLCISALKDLETLVEVVAQHYYGDKKKWNFIAITEATKVLVRLALFQNSGYKMLLHGGETLNVEMPSDDSKSQHDYLQNNYGHNSWNLEGRALSALNRFGENARTASEPRPTLSKLLSAKGTIGALFVMGEVLFITRPLIYVLFIRKYGIRSWIPWFLSLAVDFTGLGFLSLATRSRHAGKEQTFHLSTSEKDELKRRKLLWALYLMRDPFFSKYTRQRLESSGKQLESIPIIGFLTEKIIELVDGAQTRYTYMSGS
ncbi:peroxisome biogenesis protein 16 [Citrus sinensis]|nr:peroxisome biogenesis protein 16 [Citrus sinensis]